MDVTTDKNLDEEFKRYLHIMRPFLAKLKDGRVIELCNAWIQKLSNCKDSEKVLRNKYVLQLCFQLSKSMLTDPFISLPAADDLEPISDESISDTTSAEIECMVVESDDPNIKILYNNHFSISEMENLSFECVNNSKTSIKYNPDENVDVKECENLKQNVLDCRYVTKEDDYKLVDFTHFGNRTKNLVAKLREIKHQNLLLTKELQSIKEDNCCGRTDVPKLDNTTSTCCILPHASNIRVKSAEEDAQNSLDEKYFLIDALHLLQHKIYGFEERKRQEIEELERKFKLEIFKAQAEISYHNDHNQKLDELKIHYETKIAELEKKSAQDLKEAIDIRNEKDVIIRQKETEIEAIKTQMQDQKVNFNFVLKKLMDKPESNQIEEYKLKTQQMEKRLNKAERCKNKCFKIFETKVASLQREKHLTECALQLQLVKQRTEVMNEVMGENQQETNTAVEKLESKYKDLIGNLQATATQRRIQDQMALEAILQATCGIQSESSRINHVQEANRKQFNTRTMQQQKRQHNQGYGNSISALIRSRRVDNGVVDKSYGDDGVSPGYYLNGERFEELFEKASIPQRDTSKGLKK